MQPVGVGDALPDMPIFLTPDRYVPRPLEVANMASLAVFQAVLNGLIESPPITESGRGCTGGAGFRPPRPPGSSDCGQTGFAPPTV